MRTRKYASRFLPGHPLATKNGKVALHRLVLWDVLAGENAPCHWCGELVEWRTTMTVDHVDDDTTNNAADNLVPSCRGCNANRSRHGRRDLTPKSCHHCEGLFVAHPVNHSRQRYCSRKCAAAAQPPRGTSKQHGTIGRYKYGCRCPQCREANADRRYKQRHGTTVGDRRGRYNILS